MKLDLVYNFMSILLIFFVIEAAIAITTQYYVPIDKPYEELTKTQKVLWTMRFYLNIIEATLIIYALYNYSSYLNNYAILLLVLILIACLRYFFFAYGLIYYFIDKTENNIKVVNFIEGPIGKIQNIIIFLLLSFLALRIYFYEI